MTGGTTRWQQSAERGETRPDADLTWAVINAMVLALGALTMRTHIDRHLPEAFTSPAQRQRWQTSVDSLLRDGCSAHLPVTEQASTPELIPLVPNGAS